MLTPDKQLSILQINTRDVGGGAEKVARELAEGYRSEGHQSQLAVGYKRSHDPYVIEIPQGINEPLMRRLAWRTFQRLQPWYGKVTGVSRICCMVHNFASASRRRDRKNGLEDFSYPGSAFVDNLSPTPPNLLHAHNLHGDYFDLRVLPDLSSRYPMVLTLHDAWLLAGHCAHSFDCDRWETGCGACPDLSIYPAVAADATNQNWKRKREIFSRCRLHIATPCAWLMDRVKRSILAPSIVSSRVIPYGIDLKVFCPEDKKASRNVLGIDADVRVLLFAANGVRHNTFKDFNTMRSAVEKVAKGRGGHRLVFIALGEHAHDEQMGDATIRFVPFESDTKQVARYYQAADVYVHAARADTFPNAVIEAMACGTPVVASAVGGIPEQIHSLRCTSSAPDVAYYDSDTATGILVSDGDADAMARAIETLLVDDNLRQRIGCNAANDARNRFDLNRHIRDYLRWYSEILSVTRSADRAATTLLRSERIPVNLNFQSI